MEDLDNEWSSADLIKVLVPSLRQLAHLMKASIFLAVGKNEKREKFVYSSGYLSDLYERGDLKPQSSDVKLTFKSMEKAVQGKEDSKERNSSLREDSKERNSSLREDSKERNSSSVRRQGDSLSDSRKTQKQRRETRSRSKRRSSRKSRKAQRDTRSRSRHRSSSRKAMRKTRSRSNGLPLPSPFHAPSPSTLKAMHKTRSRSNHGSPLPAGPDSGLYKI